RRFWYRQDSVARSTIIASVIASKAKQSRVLEVIPFWIASAHARNDEIGHGQSGSPKTMLPQRQTDRLWSYV
ncbi:MAG: hypothetical protein P4L82_05085, partial [Ancalomicrobiaceae bacterium]|nr:hypothetical protein [Ancalomicrobiaceae bacterium]